MTPVVTRRQVLEALAGLTAVGVIRSQDVQAQIVDSDSEILNGTSGFQIRPNNGEDGDDFSLKVISGDGTKDVTFIRYKGTTAYADTFRVYVLLKALTELMGLDT